MHIISTSIYYSRTLQLLIANINNWATVFLQLLFKKPIITLTLKNGFKFISSPSNNLYDVVKEVWFERKYMPKNIFLNQKGVIIDIGANVGVFSVFASTLTKGKIIAVEPFADNCRYFKQNLKNNNINNVILEQCAISKRTGQRLLYLTDCDAGHGFYLPEKSKGSQLINTISFARLMRKHNIRNIDLLKVDCEGAEGELFSSLSSKIMNRINNISLEFHDNCSSLSHQQFETLLQNAGFLTSLDWDGQSPFGYLYATRMS